ncbi:MAG: hypothetical protein IJS14_15420 [Lentisphaeria bacterium]|nr:hypothetical protein [Lentisphaeria bacterium]
MFSMIGKKVRLWLPAVALLLALPAFSAVQVQHGKIVLGNSFQFSSNSPAEFECLVVNPDPKPHRIMIRLQSAGSFGPGQNVNSPEFEVPPRCSMTCRVPVRIGSDEKYSFAVYEDGVRRPGSVMNECEIKFPDNRHAGVGFLNDLGDIPGNFKQNKFLSRPLFQVGFRGGTLPRHREIFRLLHALLILHPDFSVWTSEQFAAVLEYAADGGLVVFADPDGILAAAKTPLAELLPVIPAGIRLIPAEQLTGKKPGKVRREVKYLDHAALTDRETDPASLTAVRERRYGFGTVRLLPFSPIVDNFPDQPEFADRTLAGLLNAPAKEQTFGGFRAPLDKLTGFTVPRTSSVRNILLVYFGLLLVIVIIGFRRKRHASTWLVCALTAVVATAAILIHVSRSLGRRAALAAVLRVENAAAPGMGKTYFSLFSPAAMTTTVQTERKRGLFENVPVAGMLRFQFGSDSGSPLDLRVMPDDGMQIRDINLAARSSRQFMEHTSPTVLPGGTPGWKTPRLRLSRTGLRLEPWQLPGPAPEAVFVLFPNGSKLAERSLNGSWTMKNTDSAIADPLVEDLRRALEKSHSKQHPGVAVISGSTAPHPGLDPKFMVQGKTLTLYPADVRIDAGKVTVPTELVVLAPAETGSRIALDGGRINPEYTLQASMSIAFAFAPAPVLPPAMGYSSVRVKASISGSDRIEAAVRLNTAGGKAVKGRKIASGEYVFEFKDPRILFAGNRPAKLNIEGVLKKKNGPDQDFAVNNWSLLDLQIELQGEMTENKEKLP